MSQKNTQRVINKLTADEDLRQDLWVCHLSGTPSDSLHIFMDNLQATKQVNEKSFDYQSFLNDPVSSKLLKHFTNLELHIIYLLTIGHDIITISRYKGIAEVRVRQIITAIQSSKVWDEIWHSRDTSQMKRNLA